VHDVGKAREGDHSVVGAEMAACMTERLGLGEEGRQAIDFLIRHHLKMSRIAFRRDTEEPAVVRQFTSLFGTEAHLKMLVLLTLADVGAVSPETLTPWKEELLWRLYVDATPHDARVRRGSSTGGRCSPRSGTVLAISREVMARLRSLPPGICCCFAGRHYPRAPFMRYPVGRGAFLEKKVRLSTVVSPTNVFSNIAACLTRRFSGARHEPGSRRSTSSSSPTATVPEHLKRRTSLWHARGEERQADDGAAQEARAAPRSGKACPAHAVVYFDSGHSQRYTVLELVAEDAPGLLYRVSRVISNHGIDVDLVLISTEGHKAIDVFHITRGGAKLSEDAEAALKADLERMLKESA
jgi:[protein-PII] uridylyltransferase